MENKTAEKYVTCFNAQHTFRVLPGSEADTKYQANQYIGTGNCPECADDQKAYFRQHMRSCECYDELCNQGKGCAYAQDLASIPEGTNGLVFLPVSESWPEL